MNGQGSEQPVSPLDLEIPPEMFDALEADLRKEEENKLLQKYEGIIRDALEKFTEFHLPDFFHYFSTLDEIKEKKPIVEAAVANVQKEFATNPEKQKRLFQRIAVFKLNEWIQTYNAKDSQAQAEKLAEELSADFEEYCAPHEGSDGFGSSVAFDSIKLFSKLTLIRKWIVNAQGDDRHLQPITSVDDFLNKTEETLWQEVLHRSSAAN